MSWKATNRTDISSTIPIMFTQSYQWAVSVTSCNQSSHISNLPGVFTLPDMLACASNSSLCGGYSPLQTRGYCVDSSLSLNSRSTQISNIENITANSSFCIAFQSKFWRNIRSPSCGFSCTANNLSWSIGSCINLTVRSEGFINTPPVATVISRKDFSSYRENSILYFANCLSKRFLHAAIRVSITSSTNIKIPVIDADNDLVR